MRGRPHEGADDRFGEKEALVRGRFDTGDPHVRRHTHDSDAVLCGGDRPSGMRPVPEDVVAWQKRRRGSARAVSARCCVIVRSEVRMREVEPGVDIPDDDVRTAARDRVGLRRMDLSHVPLQREQGIRRIVGREIRQVTHGRPHRFETRAVDMNAESGRRCCTRDVAVFQDGTPERRRVRPRHDDTDLRVARDDRTTRLVDRCSGPVQDRGLPVQDDVRGCACTSDRGRG